MMIHVIEEEGDAAAFISSVDAVLSSIVKIYAPPEIILVKVDNWFGRKWLRFSGKVAGAIGVWRQELTIPPFVPNRVMWQRRCLAPSYLDVPSEYQLHVVTSTATGQGAPTRLVSEVAHGAALVWFSGASEANGRAALMAYIPDSDSYWVWYAGFSRKETWYLSYLSGISATEFEAMTNP